MNSNRIDNRSKAVKFFQGFDQVGVPISLNLKGETEHKTAFGGLCSLLVIALLMIVMVGEVTQVFFELNFTKTETVSFMQTFDGHEAFSISTDSVIPAIYLAINGPA